MADKWVVVPNGQRKTTEIMPGGTGFQNVWDVMFQVTDGAAKGTYASVRVPETQHTAADVKAAIDAKVAALNEIAAL